MTGDSIDEMAGGDLDVVYTVTYVDNLGVFDDMVSSSDYVRSARSAYVDRVSGTSYAYHRYVLALDVDSGVSE